MKIYNLILLLIASLLFCCTKKNERSLQLIPNNDSLSVYLAEGKNVELSYYNRDKNNRKALQILVKRPNDSTNREHLLKVSWNFFFIKKWEDLKTTAILVSKRAKEKKDTLHIAGSYRCMGAYYENTSQNDSAFFYYLKAKKHFGKLKNNREICRSLQDLAMVQCYSNDYWGSELSLINALKIAKKDKLVNDQYFINMLIGINSCGLKNYGKAVEYHTKALNILLENDGIKHNNDVANCLSNIGTSYMYNGNFKESVAFFEKALKEYDHKKKTPDIYTYTLNNYANSKIQLGNLLGVKDTLFKVSKIMDSTGIDQGRNFNKMFISEYYASVKDTINSIIYAKEAVQVSKEFNAPDDILRCLKQLSKVDPSNALKYATEYIKVSDSMQLLERKTRNKFAKIAYETEEITNEKETAVYQKYIFLGVAILVFIVGLLLVMVISQRTKQKELQFTQEQQKNNEEVYQLIQSRQSKINEGRHTEKQRIARDLHDGIMNRLAATRLNLHALNENSDRETIKKCLPFIDGIQNIEKEIRNIAHDLNKDVFSNTNSFTIITESLFEEQRVVSQIKCHLEIDPEINWDQIEGSLKIDIYRIFQEALNNTNKHAHANNIVASILKKEHHLLLEIYDDGIGFSLNGKKKGIGLQNIYSRVKAFNGTVDIKSKKDEGTALIITIPIKSNT